MKNEINPNTHLLYVKWACKHLTIIKKCIKIINDEHNINMLDIINAMDNEYNKLITNNKAYKDAHEILDLIESATIDYFNE